MLSFPIRRKPLTDAASQHLAGEAAETVDAQPEIELVRADVDPLNPPHNTRLLGEKEFIP
jgi:hypothetical protein